LSLRLDRCTAVHRTSETQHRDNRGKIQLYQPNRLHPVASSGRLVGIPGK
jgi:hypothetical protein